MRASAAVTARTRLPAVSVVIAAYSSERWDYLRDAVESVRAQTAPVLETIVVVDHNPALADRARSELTGATVLANTGTRGASGARNTGVAASRGEIVAFLDDDARATYRWLASLLRHFADADVVGAGGRVEPLWATRRPRWFPMEFAWSVGASYRGMPETTRAVRNVWSNNMAIRRSVFEAVGGFRDDFGKVGERSRPEDTDLCLRAAEGRGRWIYEPEGAVGHWVPGRRATFGYFARRCFDEGQGKAALAALDGAGQSTSDERRYTRRVLPRGVLAGLRDTLAGDASGALRSAAIAAGFAIAVTGFAVGWAAARTGNDHAVRTENDHAARTEKNDFEPVRVCEVELSEPLPAIRAHADAGDPRGRRYGAALVLARWYSEPLAVARLPLADGDLSPESLAAALWPEVARPLTERLAAAGEPAPASLPRGGMRLAAPAPFLTERATALANAPLASVIICTRDRAERLGCCLDAAEAQSYPRYEIVVVDNAPATDAVAKLVADRGAPVSVRYVAEHLPGLSWARNAGLAAAEGRIVAFLDDDERPDRHWLAELVRGLTTVPRAAGVSGTVLPAVLATEAQSLFERFGGHSKGRGFTPAIFDAASHARQHPLYPLPPFGVGANMAFDAAALRAIGGFDVALGAGTPACAGEDTAAISDLMLTGATFVYRPAAITWHEHRDEFGELERQLNGYGSGLTAFYTRVLLRDPRRLGTLLRLAPRALRDMRGHGSVRTAAMGAGYPAALRRASFLGMLAGPGRYLRSRHVQARVARRTS